MLYESNQRSPMLSNYKGKEEVEYKSLDVFVASERYVVPNDARFPSWLRFERNRVRRNVSGRRFLVLALYFGIDNLSIIWPREPVMYNDGRTARMSFAIRR